MLSNENNDYSYGTPTEPPLFGWELIMDLYECAHESIATEEIIQRYAKEICSVIDMEPYGDPLTPYFGEKQEHTKGFSLIQFIETSSITGHFSENTGAAYINIFSCKQYDFEKAEKFTKAFFGAKRISSRYLIRR
ncbi:MAG: S-adenosylmethionine decarboxylase [Desulfatiglans sp.]|jgi:S-adenosylmethionine/arginine decarboxylase-like enzyme|nr:S-adenosylmethionine decarboxylase [Thermodesulfobacteriota bacterium]MEE4354220.1 S-adenosylmethionine decarboxylase [Desulfatiglans sp.]